VVGNAVFLILQIRTQAQKVEMAPGCLEFGDWGHPNPLHRVALCAPGHCSFSLKLINQCSLICGLAYLFDDTFWAFLQVE
jgi:hypothetical protein